MRLNRRKFLGILSVAPVVGAAVIAAATRLKPQAETVQLPTLPEPKFPNPHDLFEVERLARYYASVGDNGEVQTSLDGVTWIDRRGGVSFNDFDIKPMSPFLESK